MIFEKIMPPTSLIQTYLTALQNGIVGEDLAQFFCEDAIQIELPNRLNPNGQTSDLANIISRSIQGQKILSAQSYTITNLIESSVSDESQKVAVEAHWIGTLAIPIGEMKAGMVMKANFAMFFELKNGKIWRQRNYDCFELF